MIFDTHAHYSDHQFDADRDAILSAHAAHNVGTVIEVGVGRQECEDALMLAARYPHVYAALGFHPDNVGELNEEVFAWLKDTAVQEAKVVAIGEIGLDYHWNVESHETQAYWFVRQMELARKLDLPVSIHSREAAKDTFDLFCEHGEGIRGSMHCYAYSPEMALEYVRRGLMIGVGGVVTFKNGRKLKETVAQIPIESILLETDCPYLAPTPHRGERNESAYIDLIADSIAQIRGMDKDEVIAITEENAKKLFLPAH